MSFNTGTGSSGSDINLNVQVGSADITALQTKTSSLSADGLTYTGSVTGNVTGTASGNLTTANSVADLIDVSDPGSGQIITTFERNQITANAADIAINNTIITTKANDADVVKLTGAQTIAGQKTFNDTIVGTTTGNLVSSDIAGKANISDVVTLTGSQTITGSNDFTGSNRFTDVGARGAGTVGGAAGKIKLFCQMNTHSVDIQSPAHSAYSGSYTLTLPTSAGTSGQVLQTDGNGVLSWVNQTTGGGGGGGGGLSHIILNNNVSIPNDGTASSNLQFRVNEAPLGKDILLTPSAVGITFNPTSLVIHDSQHHSETFTIAASSSLSAGVYSGPISVAIGSQAPNTTTSPINVDLNVRTITITAAAALTNDPWTSSAPNGWKQVKNLPVNSSGQTWYSGNNFDFTGTETNTSAFTSSTYTSEWQVTPTTAGAANYNQVLLQDMQKPISGTAPDRWMILTKADYLAIYSTTAFTVTAIASGGGDDNNVFAVEKAPGYLDSHPRINFWNINNNNRIAYLDNGFADSWAQFTDGRGVFIRTYTGTDVPWSVTSANGWSHVMHVPAGSQWFYGQIIQLTVANNTSTLTYDHTNVHPSNQTTRNTLVSQGRTATSVWQKDWGTLWTEICFQTTPPTGTSAYWVIFKWSDLKSYVDGRTNYNNDYSTPFRKDTNTGSTAHPTFADGGVVAASHDYVWFHFNNQDGPTNNVNPYVRLGTTDNAAQSQLIFMEGGATGSGTWTQIDEHSIGVFVR